MLSALRSRSSREDGFTLFEIVIVVAIIAILAAIAVPVYYNRVQDGYVTTLQADVSQSAINLSEYYQQNKQWPNDADLNNAQRATPMTATAYFNKNLKVVTSGSGGSVKAFIYQGVQTGSQINADTSDAPILDMACVQGTNTTKIHDTKRQVWSYYFTPYGAATAGSLGTNTFNAEEESMSLHNNNTMRLGPCNDHGINTIISAGQVAEDEGLIADPSQGVGGWTLTQTLG